MHNFFLLVKNNLIETFASIGRNTTSKKRKIAYIILYVFLFCYLGGFAGYFAYSIGSAVSSVGMSKLLILLAFVLSNAMLLFITFFSSFGLLFKSKDYELVSALPIKKTTIALSKFFSLLVLCYSYSIVFFLAFIIMYFVFAGFSIITLLISIIGFILLPLFPIFIGATLSLLVNLITTKMKYKNIINIVLLLGLFIGIMFLNQSMNDIIVSVINNSSGTYEILGSIFFPALFITNAAASFNWLHLLWYVLISIVPISILGIIICSKYFKLNNYFSKSARYKETKYAASSHSTGMALLNKELTRIFSSPMYFLNSCLGPILLLIVSITTCFGSTNLIGIEGLGTGLSLVLLAVPCLSLFMNTTSVSFSLEGKSFWLLKNLPVSLTQIILMKILAMCVIFVVPGLIGCVILGIALKLSLLEQLIMYILLFLTILLSAVIGIFVGLKHCNLNWTNETMVVKQSYSTLISMLIGLIFGIIPGIIYTSSLLTIMNATWFGLIMIVFYSLAIVIFSFIIKKNAKNIFNNLN